MTIEPMPVLTGKAAARFIKQHLNPEPMEVTEQQIEMYLEMKGDEE